MSCNKLQGGFSYLDNIYIFFFCILTFLIDREAYSLLLTPPCILGLGYSLMISYFYTVLNKYPLEYQQTADRYDHQIPHISMYMACMGRAICHFELTNYTDIAQ